MRYYLWSSIVLPLFILILILVLNRRESLDILTSEDISYYEFTDKAIGGKSVASIRKNGDTLTARCILKKGAQYPFSGIQLFKLDSSYFNLADFDISMRIKANYEARISLRLNQFIEGYSDTCNQMSYLLLVKSFGLNKGENQINLKIKDINEIPNWWFLENLKMINKIDEIKYDRNKYIWLYIENSTPLNKPLDLEISEFTFSYSYLPLLYRFSLFAFLYYLALIFVLWKVKKVKYILMPIESSKIGNKIPETQAEILAFIGNNYKNSDLKLYDVAKATKVSQDNVSELIRKHSNLTFRQYLNKVRLEEAKRLIRSTDWQISQIAFEVGYNNIQHFNRVFKDYTSFTPKEFRELK